MDKRLNRFCPHCGSTLIISDYEPVEEAYYTDNEKKILTQYKIVHECQDCHSTWEKPTVFMGVSV